MDEEQLENLKLDLITIAETAIRLGVDKYGDDLDAVAEEVANAIAGNDPEAEIVEE